MKRALTTTDLIPRLLSDVRSAFDSLTRIVWRAVELIVAAGASNQPPHAPE